MMSTSLPCLELHNAYIPQIDMPQRLHMKWQHTVSSNESDDDESDELYYDESEDVNIFEPECLDEMSILHQKQRRNIPITDGNNNENNTLHIDSIDNIIRIVVQFGDCTNYPMSVLIDIIVDGYIHNLESNITPIIPSDIHSIILSFYNVREYKYIHFAYKLYKSLHIATNAEPGFSGKALISTVESNHLHQYLNENIHEIYNHLIEYKVIELTSYKMNFFSFIDPSQNNPDQQSSFVASDDYIYKLSSNYLSIFQKYSTTLTSKTSQYGESN